MIVSLADPTSFVKTVAEGIQEKQEGMPVPFMVKLPMFTDNLEYMRAEHGVAAISRNKIEEVLLTLAKKEQDQE